MADPVSIVINIALQAALRLAIAALTPKQVNEGPRLDDTAITTSTYGETIPLGYGTCIMAGNVIWGKNLEEVVSVRSIGKGGKFSAGKDISYTYYATFAVGISRRQIDRVLRIYADGKIIYDETNDDVDRTAIIDGLNFNVHRGTMDQDRDPIIEADVGTDKCPAFRGIAYIVFNRFPLKEFGNRIPQVRFVVSFIASEGDRVSYNFDGMRDDGFNSSAFDIDRDILYTKGEINDGSNKAALFVHDGYNGDLLYSRPLSEYPNFNNGLNTNQILRSGTSRCPYLVLETLNGSTGQYAVIDKETLTLLGMSLRSGTTKLCDGDLVVKISALTAQSNVDPLCGGTPTPQPYLDGAANFEIIAGPDPISAVPGDVAVDQQYGAELGHFGVFMGDRTISGVGTATVGVTQLTPSGHKWLWGTGDIGASVDGVAIEGACREGSIVKGPTLNGDRYFFIAVEEDNGGRGPYHILAVRIQDTKLANLDDSEDGNAALLNSYNAATDEYTGFNGIHPTIIATIPQQSSTGTNAGAHYLWYDERADILVWVAEGLQDDPATRAYALNTTGFGLGDVPGISNDEPVSFNAQLIWELDETIIPPFTSTSHHDYSTGLIYTTDTQFRRSFFYDIETGELVETLESNANDYPLGDGISWNSVSNRQFIFLPDGRQLDPFEGLFYYYPPYGRGQEDLSVVVADICQRSKLTPGDIDVTALTGTLVQGYAIARNLPYRAAIEPLMNAYNFYGVEKDGKLVFDFHTSIADTVIPEDDLVRTGNENIFEESRGQELETPRALFVQHLDPAQNDNKMVQGARRISNPDQTMGSIGEQTVELPLYLTATEGAKVAERILYDSWVQRESVRFRVSQKYLETIPNDTLQVTAAGRTETIRATRVSVGANFLMEIEGPVVENAIYNQRIEGVVPPGSPNWTPGGDLALVSKFVTGFLFDIPLLEDGHLSSRDNGMVYCAGSQAPAAGGGQYPGSLFLTSFDGDPFDPSAQTSTAAPWGVVRGEVPDSPGVDWNGIQDEADGGVIEVDVFSGADQFNTITEAQLLKNGNSAVLYRVGTGHCEIIGFQNVETLANGNLQLSKLIRGKRGTNTFALRYGDNSGISEDNPNPVVYLVLLDQQWVSGFSKGIGVDDTALNYRVVPTSNTQFVARTGSQFFEHRSLAPYEPSHIKLVPESGSFELQWTRRTRQGGSLRSNATGDGAVPLSEDSERYRIELCAQGAAGGPDAIVKATITMLDGTKFNHIRPEYADLGAFYETTSPAVEIPLADMTLMGYNTFNVQNGTDPIYVRVRQVSEQVGPGMGEVRAVYLEQ